MNHLRQQWRQVQKTAGVVRILSDEERADLVSQTWYHGGADPSAFTEGYIHLGTRKAAMRRMDPTQWDVAAENPQVALAELWSVKLVPDAVALAPELREDSGDVGVLGYEPGGVQMVAYVNEWEHPGSISLLAHTSFIRQTSHEPHPFPTERERYIERIREVVMGEDYAWEGDLDLYLSDYPIAERIPGIRSWAASGFTVTIQREDSLRAGNIRKWEAVVKRGDVFQVVPLHAGTLEEAIANFEARLGHSLDWTTDEYGAQTKVAHAQPGTPLFQREAHETLYPCLFEGTDLRPGARDAIIDYFNEHVTSQVDEADPEVLQFNIIGSGISYNWDEGGDLDVQVWAPADLVSPLRRALGPHNNPTHADLGLTNDDCGGVMVIQFYVKAGRGTREDNLIQQPYACYDLTADEWLKEPVPFGPDFYATNFADVYDQAQAIASRVDALISTLMRETSEARYWEALVANGREEFAGYAQQAVEAARDTHDEVRSLYKELAGGRMRAYEPGGSGIWDERDALVKSLQVLDVWDDLKHWGQMRDLPLEPA